VTAVTEQFRDRREAGQRLAERLNTIRVWTDTVVLALPRGGVPVAYEVAQALDAPLDVFLVRKLGVPGHEELAMGAIATGGVRVLNDDVVASIAVPPADIDAVAAREQEELVRRERAYRGDRPSIPLGDRAVIVVDDGLATGATMRAAVAAIRRQGPARITVAVPVAAPAACVDLGAIADEVLCLRTPEPFAAVGYWYQRFGETSDDEVRSLLAQAAASYDRRVA
jgi:predicted phosphoribosyltransferase